MPPFLLTSLILFVIWLVFLFVSKDTRKEQTIMSLVGLVLGPAILLIAGSNYRAVEPTGTFSVGIEDLIFSTCLFGVASIIYHVLFGKHLHKFKGDKLRLRNPLVHWGAHLILALGTWVCLTLGAIALFAVPPMQAALFGGLMIGIYIIANRHDLFIDALMSGLLTSALIFILEQLFFIRLYPDIAAHYWHWSTISNFVLGGIPLEELSWAAVVGFTIGPMYEWLRRYFLK